MDREQALETALGQIERNFGKGAVMKMSDQAHVSIGAISTGSLALDLPEGGVQCLLAIQSQTSSP